MHVLYTYLFLSAAGNRWTNRDNWFSRRYCAETFSWKLHLSFEKASFFFKHHTQLTFSLQLHTELVALSFDILYVLVLELAVTETYTFI